MRVSIEWLKDYVDVEDSPANLADRLTFSGMEVEGIEHFGTDLTGWVASEVRAVDPHPKADRLTLCRVFDGTRELQVVCGAPNVKAGGRYPLAPIGAMLPDGTKIRSEKIRGIVSEGMLCSEAELGFSKDHTGLMNLDPGLVPGVLLADLFGRPDTVLDLEITPNRPDCLSLLGVARELAALYGLPLKRPAVDVGASDVPVETRVTVTVEDQELCPRYLARVLTGLRVAPSPYWMQRRLRAAGVRAVNTIVDITNYVLIESGHPLHAFDLDRIEGGRITVRRARPGERLKTLDGVDRELQPEMLVIADATRAVALAGIMGGTGSEIQPDSCRVLLESACFHPSNIRRTSRRLGLTTESSYRFARGTDPETAEWASRRAAALMGSLTGASLGRGRIDLYPAPRSSVLIACPWKTFSRALGDEAPSQDIVETLKSIELQVVQRDAKGAEWRIPPFRLDLRFPIDLVEEFARLRGLDRISERGPSARIVPGAEDRTLRAVQNIRGRLVGLGLTEILNYSLLSEALLNLMDPASAARRVRLPNPLSEDQSILRTSLLPQMVETLGRNRSRQIEEAACFEIGRVFSTSLKGGVTETSRIAVGLMGPVNQPVLERRAIPNPQRQLQWIKGIVEALFRSQNLDDWEMQAWEGDPFAAGSALCISVKGTPIGTLGLLAPRIASEWRMNDPIALAELDLDPLLARIHSLSPVRPPPVYPCSVRDLAFIVDKSIRHEDIVSVVWSVAPTELERVDLFDVYEGKGINPGCKSVAYAFTWRSSARTLTDLEVARYDGLVREAIQKKFRAEIRDR